jgi:hypothetical protein
MKRSNPDYYFVAASDDIVGEVKHFCQLLEFLRLTGTGTGEIGVMLSSAEP